MIVDGAFQALTTGAQLQSAQGPGDLARAEGALRGARSGELDGEAVGDQFEALFATMLVREMRKSSSGFSSEGGIFGKGSGSDVYEGWFDEHLGAALAEQDALGLVGMVKASIGRMQEQEQESNS